MLAFWATLSLPFIPLWVNAVLHMQCTMGLLVPEIKYIVLRTYKNCALFASKTLNQPKTNTNNIPGYGELISNWMNKYRDEQENQKRSLPREKL